MPDPKPVFIADTCVCGLSVIKAMWNSGSAGNAVFMADYAVNPIGVKSDSEITAVVESWLRTAEEHSDTLVIACNTLSIRYQQLTRSNKPSSSLRHIVTMVDCFAAMVKAETARLAGSKVLIIGTEFTARQQVYPEILASALPGTRVSTIGATELERKIARFQTGENGGDAIFSAALEQAIGETDVAVLACTCFPLVRMQLESQFPQVIFLDPGAYCSGLLQPDEMTHNPKLAIRVSGDVVAKIRVIDFAKQYLGSDAITWFC